MNEKLKKVLLEAYEDLMRDDPQFADKQVYQRWYQGNDSRHLSKKFGHEALAAAAKYITDIEELATTSTYNAPAKSTRYGSAYILGKLNQAIRINSKGGHLLKPGFYIVEAHISFGRRAIAGPFDDKETAASWAAGKLQYDHENSKTMMVHTHGEFQGSPRQVDLAPSMVAEDMLPGGEGDDMDLCTVSRSQLVAGLRVEMEHTNDPAMALEIALDHLAEDEAYYTKHQQAGLEEEEMIAGDEEVPEDAFDDAEKVAVDQALGKSLDKLAKKIGGEQEEEEANKRGSAEKLPMSFYEVEDPSIEETLGSGAQYSGPPLDRKADDPSQDYDMFMDDMMKTLGDV